MEGERGRSREPKKTNVCVLSVSPRPLFGGVRSFRVFLGVSPWVRVAADGRAEASDLRIAFKRTNQQVPERKTERTNYNNFKGYRFARFGLLLWLPLWLALAGSVWDGRVRPPRPLLERAWPGRCTRG